jgi:hypothetical protein
VSSIWRTGGYAPGMFFDITDRKTAMQIYGESVPLGLCMAVAHGGDGFWYYAPVTKDGDRYTARLDEKFCGYAWALQTTLQPDQRQRYLLLAGETVTIEKAVQP